MSSKWFEIRSSYRNQLLKIPVVDPAMLATSVYRTSYDFKTGIYYWYRKRTVPHTCCITGRDASSFTFSITGNLVPSAVWPSRHSAMLLVRTYVTYIPSWYAAVCRWLLLSTWRSCSCFAQSCRWLSVCIGN